MFQGTDFDARTGKNGIFKIQGENKGWAESVDSEGGNADYMMFCDVDYHHEECSRDVKNWGKWVVKEAGLSGFRLDAVQHYSERFTNEWIDEINDACGNQFYVGEFWTGNVKDLTEWLDKMNHKMSLYDSPLLNNFASLSTQEAADLRKVFDGSLVQAKPVNAVTVVQNHDTQKGQTMATPIEGFFKPLAYALILLRKDGYPCLFYGDLYGTQGDEAEKPSCGNKLADMTLARRLYAYGEQDDYWDQANCIGEFALRGLLSSFVR